MIQYVELHAASAFSFLDGASLPEELAGLAAHLDMPAMALLDRDGFYGSPRFHLAANKAGIRAHIGAEVTSTTGIRYPLLAETREGYQNLCRLMTRMKLRAPKGKGTIAEEELIPFSRGLICLTGGGYGPLTSAIQTKTGHQALERLGGALIFHTVAIRPGKPVLFGTASGGRLVFGLPGNPAAATLGFELFVRLAIRLLLGDRNPERPRVRARLRGSLSQVKGLTFFPRGRISAEGSQLVFAPGAQQSSMQIASWSGANAVAVIPPGEGRVDEGAEIEVLLTGNIA